MAAPNEVVTGEEMSADLGNHVSIYPNPCSNVLNVRIDNVGESKVTISNTVGDKVYETKYSSTNSTTALPIDITNFEKGIYFVQISALNRLTVNKIIVE